MLNKREKVMHNEKNDDKLVNLDIIIKMHRILR